MASSDAYTNYKARIAKHIFPDAYRDVDGYWYWAPTGSLGGYSEHDVLMISTLLGEANRNWDIELTEYFRKNR